MARAIFPSYLNKGRCKTHRLPDQLDVTGSGRFFRVGLYLLWSARRDGCRSLLMAITNRQPRPPSRRVTRRQVLVETPSLDPLIG